MIFDFANIWYLVRHCLLKSNGTNEKLRDVSIRWVEARRFSDYRTHAQTWTEYGIVFELSLTQRTHMEHCSRRHTACDILFIYCGFRICLANEDIHVHILKCLRRINCMLIQESITIKITNCDVFLSVCLAMRGWNASWSHMWQDMMALPSSIRNMFYENYTLKKEFIIYNEKHPLS